MKILNLVYQEKSDIKYKISKFPDGQQQITIDKESLLVELDSPFKDIYLEYCRISSYLNNFKDLELIICSVTSLRNLGVKEIHLYCPYILGARSDKQFEEGSNNYLKQVICPILNSLNLSSITVIDPHSDCLEMGLNNFKKEDNLDLIKFVFDNGWNSLKMSDTVWISSDSGSTKKIYKLTEKIGYEGKIITCSKDRDIYGKLIKETNLEEIRNRLKI